ncbi:MAG: hypothetical protein IPG22_19155 [Acidobacteria bacterium]|nr:hypothetical protein [Acidobacteriota bacterium]
MFKKLVSVTLLAVVLGATALAQDTPRDVNDLVGARAAGGETTLKSRGYKFIKTSKSDDRSYSNWWKASNKTCLTVVTLNGRYDSIVSGPEEDCKTGGSDSSSGDGAPSDVADLVGTKASGGESDLKSRGYRFIKTSKGGDRSYSNWWKSSSSTCLTVATFNGRFDTIVSGPAEDCRTGSGGSSASASSNQVDLSDLVGARGAGAETEMQSRGFRNVKGKKIGSTSYTYWKNDDSGQCVQVAVRNGNVASILRSNANNCK